MRVCSIIGCGEKFYAKGLCKKHYDKKKWRINSKKIMESRALRMIPSIVNFMKRKIQRNTSPQNPQLPQEILTNWRGVLSECEYIKLKNWVEGGMKV